VSVRHASTFEAGTGAIQIDHARVRVLSSELRFSESELGLDSNHSSSYLLRDGRSSVQGDWEHPCRTRQKFIQTYALRERLPVTLTLASFSLLLQFSFGVPLAVVGH